MNRQGNPVLLTANSATLLRNPSWPNAVFTMCVPWQMALKPITLFCECSVKLSQYRDLEEHLGARISRLPSEGKGSGRRV